VPYPWDKMHYNSRGQRNDATRVRARKQRSACSPAAVTGQRERKAANADPQCSRAVDVACRSRNASCLHVDRSLDAHVVDWVDIVHRDCKKSRG
jgi:hypothetical protein